MILVDGDKSFFFAGDASYTEDLLIAGKIDGIGPDPRTQHETYLQILSYAAENPTVYLPSHDPGSKMRLENRATLYARAESKVPAL